MTHDEIERGDIAEEYVRGRLSSGPRAAFEDHFFACDECFQKVQALQQLASGVGDAVEAGDLPLSSPLQPSRWWETGFYVSAAASVALAAALGWSTLRERPRLLSEVTVLRQASEAGQRRLSELERQLSARAAAPQPSAALANLPLLMLESSRAQEAHSFPVPESSPHVALWMEPPPAPPQSTYRLEIRNATGETIAVVEGSKTNAYGALAVSIPTGQLKPGPYNARLYRLQSGTPVLAADYRFAIIR